MTPRPGLLPVHVLLRRDSQRRPGDQRLPGHRQFVRRARACGHIHPAGVGAIVHSVLALELYPAGLLCAAAGLCVACGCAACPCALCGIPCGTPREALTPPHTPHAPSRSAPAFSAGSSAVRRSRRSARWGRRLTGPCTECGRSTARPSGAPSRSMPPRRRCTVSSRTRRSRRCAPSTH